MIKERKIINDNGVGLAKGEVWGTEKEGGSCNALYVIG